MAISYQLVIKKMIQELTEAQVNDLNRTQLLKHIYHVQGLCQLLIDDEGSFAGTKPAIEQETTTPPQQVMHHTYNNKNEDDEDSIFDF